MISGANEEELELAEARMDIMLATNYTTENSGPLAIIDKYHDKEIERLHSIIQEIKCLIHKAINERELNGVGELDLTRILSLLDEEGDNNEK